MCRLLLRLFFTCAVVDFFGASFAGPNVVGWGGRSGATPPGAETNAPPSLTNAVALSAGYGFSAAVTPDGHVVMWGAPPFSDRGIMDTPSDLADVTAISCGAEHTLVLLRDGTVRAWGFDLRGQSSPPPGAVDCVAVSAGADHSLALLRDGSVIGWGNNQYGAAMPPETLSNVKAISGGWNFSLALLNDGSVIGWGSAQFGAAAVPQSLTNAVAIAAGDFCAAAIRSDGTALYWGRDAYFNTVPPEGIRLDGFTNLVEIGVGHCYAIGRRGDGTLVQYPSQQDPKRLAPASLPNMTELSVSVTHDLVLLGQSTPPTLTIRRQGSNIIVSWPMSATQFDLQSSSALDSPFGFASGEITADTTTQQMQLIQPAAQSSAFFRLRSHQ